MTHNRDIVPEWPPRWVGFHHVATEVWVIDISLAHVSLFARIRVCSHQAEQVSHARLNWSHDGCASTTWRLLAESLTAASHK